MKEDILHEEAMTSNHSRPDERVVNEDEFDTVANQIVNLFKDKKWSIADFLSLIEEFKEKELPSRNLRYHPDSEIEAGLELFEIFIKEKIK